MAGQSRTLKLSILADVDQLKKSLATANGDVESSSSKMAGFGKIAGAAFLAAGVAAAGYAATLLIDGVKSAIADEAAQAKLATTLKNVTGATNAQVAATEAYILKTSLASGIADDELRPSLERLLRATQDVEQAQKLQTLALDVAAGSGKSLEAVSNALGKAYEGNSGALAKLGIGLSAAELKTMSMDDVTKALADTFGGQAAEKADTFAGKMDRLKVAFDEGKESVGAKLLPIIQQLVEFVVNEVVPALGKFADFFKPITKAVEDNKETFADLISFLQKYVVPVLVTGLGGALKIIAQIIAGLVTGFANLLSGIGKVVNAVKAFIKLMTDNPVTRFFGGGDNSKGLRVGGSEDLGMDTGGGTTGGGFDTGMPGDTFSPGADPFTFTGAPLSSYSPAMQAAILRREQLKADTERLRAQREAAAAARLEATGGLSTADRINITVNGAIDAEGTARTIVNVLNDSFYRGTGGAGALATS
jgi:hypothetical protein